MTNQSLLFFPSILLLLLQQLCTFHTSCLAPALLSLLLEPSVRNLRVINYLKYRQEYISHFDKFGHIANMTAVVSVTTILTRPTLSSTTLYSNLDASA